MAALVLFRRRQFGCGDRFAIGLEQRIVAEAMLALGGMQDAPGPEAFAEDRQRIVGVTHQRQHADELAGALGVGHLFQGLKQLGVVGRIALAVGVARGIDAGGAAEGVHRQARIVGQGRQTGQPRRVACLDDGVLDKGQPGFLGLHLAEFTHRAHPHPVAEHGLEFLELAGVVAGEHQFGKVGHGRLRVALRRAAYCTRSRARAGCAPHALRHIATRCSCRRGALTR